LTGFRVNRVDGSKIFPQIMPKIEKNAIIFRNFDINFLKQLENKSADRKIFVKIMLEEYMKEEKQFENGIKFSIIDEDNRSAEEFLPVDFVVAQNPAKQRQSILDTLKKFGDTIFEVADIQIFFEEMWFIPASKVAQVRRILVKKLLEVRLQTFEKRLTKHQKTSHTFPAQEVDYHANIHNRKAAEFYLRHQVKNHSCSFEDSAVRDAELMRTKHCLKFSFGFCPKQNPKKQPAEPLLLVRGNQKLLLGFDCKNCEMTILQSV
jgi:putative protease